MKFTVVTLFPKMIESFVESGLLGQAVTRGEAEVTTLNPRAFTKDVHHTVDDRAFGGGDGMVMKVEPLLDAIRELRAQGPCQVVLLTPQGSTWTQQMARDSAAAGDHLAFVCGRYAGIDHRLNAFVDREISLGDFILNGGEVAACAIIESVVRLRAGVLGNPLSPLRDSFGEEGLLECPQFTRPREIEGMKVPAPLLSGHHERIAEFERAVGRVRTALLRPEKLARNVRLKVEIQLLETLDDDELKSLGIRREDLKDLAAKEK